MTAVQDSVVVCLAVILTLLFMKHNEIYMIKLFYYIAKFFGKKKSLICISFNIVPKAK